MNRSEIKQIIKEEIQKILKESTEDYRDPQNPGTSEFVKIVKQVKSRYSKMFDIDINDSDIAIVTDSGYDIRIVDHPNRKKISAELESDNLPRGFVMSKEYEYTEIDKIFKIIDMWLNKYKDWL